MAEHDENEEVAAPSPDPAPKSAMELLAELVGSEQARIVADAFIDELENRLVKLGVIGRLVQRIIDALRVEWRIPDDIGGDRD